MSREAYKHLGSATVDFVDGNSAWRDRGELYLRRDGSYVLYVDETYGGGSRVFPLVGRRAEVYLGGSEQALIVEGGVR